MIFPDKDADGEDHLNQVARSLSGVAARIRVIRVKAKDPFDWIARRRHRRSALAARGAGAGMERDELEVDGEAPQS